MDQEIKTRNTPATRTQHKWYSPAKKAEVVTAYLALGNASLVEAVTKVAAGTVRSWKTQQWWKDLEAGIRDEENLQLDVKLSKIVGKTLDLLEDRLEGGDFMYDPRTAQLIRKPVNADTLNKISSEMFDRRQVLRGQRKEEEVQNVQIGDHLLKLAQEFVKIAKQQRAVTIDVEIIPDASQIRSNPEFTDSQGEIPEGSQDQRSQDLQCDSQEERSSSNEEAQGEVNGRLVDINERPMDSQIRGGDIQGLVSSGSNRWKTGWEMRSRQILDSGFTRSRSGDDEIDSASRVDSRGSQPNGLEDQGSDSNKDRKNDVLNDSGESIVISLDTGS